MDSCQGSGSGVFAWIRFRFTNFSESGSGFSTRIRILGAKSVQKLLKKLFNRKKLHPRSDLGGWIQIQSISDRIRNPE